MRIRPTPHKIIVKQEELEEKKGNIILPENIQQKPSRGVVFASASGLVKNGETVIFGKYAGTEIELNGDPYLIMDESDVLAVLRD